jgi:hypothetical protein
MTDAEVEQKFRTMVLPCYGKARVDGMLQQLWKLEDVNNSGVLVPLFNP